MNTHQQCIKMNNLQDRLANFTADGTVVLFLYTFVLFDAETRLVDNVFLKLSTVVVCARACVHMCVYVCVCVCVCMQVCPSACPFVRLSIHTSLTPTNHNVHLAV